MKLLLTILYGVLVSAFFKLSSIRILQIIIILTFVSYEHVSGLFAFIGSIVILAKQNRLILKSKIHIFLLFLMGCWVLYALITVFWAEDLIRFTTEWLQLILVALLFNTFLITVRTALDFKRVVDSFIIGGIILLIYNSFLSLDILYKHNNYVAFMVCISCVFLPLYLGKKRNVFLVFILVVAAYYNISEINESRASLILMIIVVIIRLFMLLKLHFSLKFVLFLFLGVFSVIIMKKYELSKNYIILDSLTNFQSNKSNYERLILIKESIDLFKAKPYGYGQGASLTIFLNKKLDRESYPHPHNSYSHILVELGILGFIIYLGIIFSVLVCALVFYFKYRHNKKSNLKFYFLANLFIIITLYSILEDVLFNGILNIYFMLYIALGISCYITTKSEFNDKRVY